MPTQETASEIMLQTTPENVFVFYSLESILCGLLMFGLMWALYKNPALRSSKRLILLLAAIAALGFAFFLCSSVGFYDFYFHEKLFRENPENVAFVFFLLASLLLGSAFNPPASLKSTPAFLLIIGALLGLIDLLWHAARREEVQSAHWLWLAILLVLIFISLVRTGVQASRNLLFLMFFGLVFSFSLFFFFFSENYPSGGYGVFLWAVQHAAFLGSLIACAHFIEVDTQDLFVKAFVRLNLTFVLLAGFVILLITGMERREYAEFAAREAAELMEYLRGHVMYFDGEGQGSQEILRNPEITKKIVADFGKLPDLRSVAINLNNHQLNTTINPDGIVYSRLFVDAGGLVKNRPGKFEPTIEGNVLRLSMPIYGADEITGWIELKESLTVMNKRIAHQIMIIFSAFTTIVIFSSILVGIIVTQADATIRKQYQEIEETHKQLFQAAKLAALGEMAGAVAHEINNPMGIILGRSDYLSAMAKLRKADEFVEDIEVIQRNATRTARIISELLDFARVHKLNRELHDINALLTGTVELVLPRITSQNLILSKELSPLPMLSVDAHQLQQVFVNLVNNAIDASNAGGTIHLQTSYDSTRSMVEVAVQDKGMGISSGHLKNIFDPFFTTKEGGTGLGLSVSYRIVRDHGGEISVDSVKGEGSRFTIKLPVIENIQTT
ncbi:MAG: hypothetical protein HY645_12455 [Acidobacteria bacterium]|nr:hypothetical protein [Acidobacteriota bacterium]